MRLRRPALLLLAGGLVAALVPPASGEPPCADRQAVQTFDAAGRSLKASGRGCTHRTGFLTSESHLRVAPDGTIVQQPAQTVPGVAGTGFFSGYPGPRPQTQLAPAGFAVSRDGGQRFEMVLPAGLQWVVIGEDNYGEGSARDRAGSIQRDRHALAAPSTRASSRSSVTTRSTRLSMALRLASRAACRSGVNS